LRKRLFGGTIRYEMPMLNLVAILILLLYSLLAGCLGEWVVAAELETIDWAVAWLLYGLFIRPATGRKTLHIVPTDDYRPRKPAKVLQEHQRKAA
jgi:hypothetical protein